MDPQAVRKPQPSNLAIRPVVDEIPQFGMWVGFLYIIYFISLYVWATSVGNILHEFVNRYVKDALETEEAIRSFGYFGADYIIRWSLASLIIFYPIFALVHLVIAHMMVVQPETVNIRVRKILIYITLIGTFLISSYQLVKFVYTYLDGSTSMRVFAHFATTTAITTLIFLVYCFQIRKDKAA